MRKLFPYLRTNYGRDRAIIHHLKAQIVQNQALIKLVEASFITDDRGGRDLGQNQIAEAAGDAYLEKLQLSAVKPKRFKRISKGLFRYQRSGIIYAVFKSGEKTHWINLRTNDIRHAKKLLAEELKRAKQINWKNSRMITLQNLMECYAENPMNLSDATLKNRKLLLDVFKKSWKFGLAVRVYDIKAFMLRSWLAALRKERNMSAVSLNNYLRMLRSLFGLAVELGAADENIAIQVSMLREEGPERLTPTWEQAQKIVDAVIRDKSKMGLRAMLLFGLGQGELKNLRGEHFDLEQNAITIRRQKTQKVYKIPIFPHARLFVDELKTDGWLKCGRPVFEVYNPAGALELACKRMESPAFTPRSLRRAFIIHALERGVDPRVVAAWQGHRDATLVLRVYGAWIHRDHADRMAGLLA
jgi:integrase